MPDKVHKDDVKVKLKMTISRLGSPVNDTAAIIMFFLTKPSGTVLQRTPSKPGNFTDGIAEYETVEGDLDEDGYWALAAKVTLTNGFIGFTNSELFHVYKHA